MVRARTATPAFPQAPIKSGFEDEPVDLRLDQIIFLRSVSAPARKSSKYQQIRASIREIGIIEPPMVYRDKSLKDRYILLDGHLRIDILKDMGETAVTCLLSKDDEGFTFNKYINRIATVQEHHMICRAIARGVSEAKLAAALNVDIRNIIEKRDLLDGICPEAVELLKDKVIGPKTFRPLKRMKPLRQIEVATLMGDAGVYTQSYALALLAATPKNQLLHPEKPRVIRGIDEDRMARMEAEMEGLQKEYRLIEDDYAVDVMTLTFAKGYLGALLNNALVVRYLTTNRPDILNQFRQIAEIASLNSGVAN